MPSQKYQTVLIEKGNPSRLLGGQRCQRSRALIASVAATTLGSRTTHIAFSASSRLFDLNGEASTSRTKQISAIIAPT